MIDAGSHGAVNWVDLSTPDVDAAEAFYRDLFGWTIERSTSPMGEYLIGSVGEHQVGGMMEQRSELQGMAPVWTVFFSVHDMAGTIARAKDAGGTLVEAPFPIPGDAMVAVLADPSGAMLAVIAGPNPGDAYFSHDPGAVCWVELLTHDPTAAEGFYTAAFGWKSLTQRAAQTTYTMFSLDDEDVAGMMMMPDEVPVDAPAHWAVYFAVADTTATERRALQLGGNVLHPTTEIDIGRFAVLADPQGATFQLMEFAEPV